MRVQVAIIGAGPAGMLLGHLLTRAGVEVVVLERRTRDYVEGRVRAGVLEQATVDLLVELGLADRLNSVGLRHEGVQLIFDGAHLRIDIAALTGGRAVTVYGQQEVMHDLFEAAGARGLAVNFGCEDIRIEDLDGPSARVSWRGDGGEQSLACDFIAGCDGQHGVCRASLPERALCTFERSYPFGWLGLLAEAPPVSDELIYCSHEHGFALASMRSATRSRYYLQVPANAAVEDWSDARFWEELSVRLGDDLAGRLARAPSFEKSMAPLRSSVCEPMRVGRLFLAGDAAHIVPPTGAKGLNLAAADVRVLAKALEEHFTGSGSSGLDSYSATALRRVWRAERFSWWFTAMMHRFPQADAFERKLQAAEFEQFAGSQAAQTLFAENYVGSPVQL